MKKAIMFSIGLVLLFGLGSCGKDQKPCEAEKYATFQISNNSSNPYDIWIDNVYQFRLNGNSISAQIKVSEGNNRKFYAKQVSGFILFPTEKTDNFAVLRCNAYAWQIP